MSSSSTLQLSELTCSLLRPASGQTLRLADSGGTERLGLASTAVFSCPVSAPSIDVSGSAIIGSSMVLAGPLYLAGVDISTTISGKQATITTSTALSASTLTAAARPISTVCELREGRAVTARELA